jgi:hypothetical protein
MKTSNQISPSNSVNPRLPNRIQIRSYHYAGVKVAIRSVERFAPSSWVSHVRSPSLGAHQSASSSNQQSQSKTPPFKL